MEGRLYSIQILRFFAAFGVVTAHVAFWTATLPHQSFVHHSQFGVLGVDVFFVISGLVMGRIALFRRPQPVPWDFFRDRWLRIAPIYFLLSIPWVLVAVKQGQRLIDPTVSALLFWLPGTHVAIGSAAVALPFLGVGWTLCFEMLFYCALALFLAAPRGASLVIVIVGTTCAVAFMFVAWPPAAFLGNPMILEFLAGLAIARLTIKPSVVAAITIIGGGVLTAVWGYNWMLDHGHEDVGNGVWIFVSGSVWRRVLIFGPPAVAIVYGTLRLEPWARSRLGGALAYLGDASYCLYLVHVLVIYGLALAWPRLGLSSWTFVVAALAFPISASVVTHEWIEKPLLRALRGKPVGRMVGGAATIDGPAK
ncbi:MAG TPA: acyltransferase [Caulobacteraceae bacterium]|jgi:exopolysaccharide production protein ExoZ|nr:acyltransferase [Caulobacteraceae bacterium]